VQFASSKRLQRHNEETHLSAEEHEGIAARSFALLAAVKIKSRLERQRTQAASPVSSAAEVARNFIGNHNKWRALPRLLWPTAAPKPHFVRLCPGISRITT